MDVGEAALNAVVVVREPGMVDTQEVQHGGVEVGPRHRVLGDLPADVVGRAERGPGPAARRKRPYHPAKAPPKTQTGGEETDVIPDPGPTMRKTQERTPPPPTTLPPPMSVP